jgi:hypothetical protein
MARTKRGLSLTTPENGWRTNPDPRRAWQAAFEAAPEPLRWSRELVNRRLVEGVRVCGSTVPSVRPKGFGSSMPDYLSPGEQEQFAIELSLIRQGLVDRLRADANARNRTVKTYSLVEVTRAHKAIWWPWTYLAGRDPERTALALWLACKAVPGTVFTAECKGRGLAVQTAWDRIERAGFIIATGLMRDRVPTGEASAVVAPMPSWAGALEPGARGSIGAQPPRNPGSDGGQSRVVAGIEVPPWFGEAEIAGALIGLPAAEEIIADRVRAELRADGRGMGGKAMAEFKGRVALLTSLLEGSA